LLRGFLKSVVAAEPAQTQRRRCPYGLAGLGFSGRSEATIATVPTSSRGQDLHFVTTVLEMLARRSVCSLTW